MSKPVILIVDDDETGRDTLERDHRRYGHRYRIMGVPTGRAALDRLHRLAAVRQPVALLVVDHRIVDMTGLDLMEQASALAPVAKRMLLTTYGDSEAAVAGHQAVDDRSLPAEALAAARAASLSRAR
jgi:thioredoxin reductase (NADPH)